ncbi:MAG: amino acid adenylation domain-containing protein [Firmicutes bacterium]|nr:amino acid adenylation domain-containing protein [Bacillota bacterium]
MRNFYPLTYTQKSIWNVECTFPNNSINNIAGTIRFKEEFDVALINRAINLLIKNNEALRIRFLLQNGEPVQYVANYQPYSLDVIDLREEKSYQRFFEIEAQLTETPFSLFDSDLFYLAYFQLPGESAIYLKFYHLICDAWSVKLIVDTILNNYLRLKNGEEINDSLSPSYLDYIETEKKYLNSSQFMKSKDFWNKKVETIPEFIYLKNKPLHYSIRAKRISFLIPEEISLKITHYCEERKISIFTMFVAVFSIYIHQTTSKNDIMIGTTVLNRLNHIEKNTIGMFVNTIPIRLNIDKSLDFKSYLSYISSEWKNILRHQRYPYHFILKEYRQKNQIAGDLLDVTITYQNAEFTTAKGFRQFKGRWHPYGHQANSLNIHINDREGSNSYVVNLDYLTDLFTADEIKKLYHHLIHLLTEALNFPSKAITGLGLLSDDERRQLLFEFNDPRQITTPDNILHQLVEKQALQYPENTALVFRNQQINYRDLNKRAAQLAHCLRKKGVSRGSIVGLLVNRSLEMVIAILGILKAGGAYLPISPDCPEDRIKRILWDSNCELLISDITGLGFDWNGEIINLRTMPAEILENDLAPLNPNHPGDPAYIIYTSGSTGQPKGVVIEHQSITNTVKWRRDYYGFNSGDVLLQIPPYDFDSSVEDIFTFLSVGAKIIIVAQETRFDLMYLRKLITEHQVTHFLITPSLYKTMLDEIEGDLSRLRSVTVAGESFQPSLFQKHFEKLSRVKLYNEYGPTENSVCSTVYEFSGQEEEVFIGKPIRNCQCYVLNQNLQLLPAGFLGELCLGGAGLARGYLNNPELTAEKFISVDRTQFTVAGHNQANEVGLADGPQWALAPGFADGSCAQTGGVYERGGSLGGLRLYKTGDLVRWTLDGNLKFIERLDNQIKIRGFRVELDEIKNVILRYPGIQDAIVVAKEGFNSQKMICAYLVAGKSFDLSKLKEFLNPRLPNYMIPSHFLIIEKMPISHNGKVDPAKLPEIIQPLSEIVKPETEIEKHLVKAWEEILKVNIGATDDVFERGADSISIIQVLTILYDRNWSLSVQDFYKYRTVREMANYIQNSGAQALPKFSMKGNLSAAHPLKIFHYLRRPSLSVNKSLSNIFLTGVTGFLGVHILYELLKTTGAVIYCLVRGAAETEAINKFNSAIHFYFPELEDQLLKHRVIIVRGDLQQHHLGISEDEYHKLFQTIDTVIHAAALVKHYGEYRDFEKTNVGGVQEIVKFSSGKHLFYISTTSISGNCLPGSKKGRFTEEEFDTGQNFSENYYLHTKFEAEKIVREAVGEGLQATILRIGNLTGRYRDGQFQRNIRENRFYNTLISLIDLKAVPKSILPLKLEFTPVDKCSEAIVRLLLVNESRGKTFHLTNDNYLSVRAFLKWFQSYGSRIKVLNDSEFHHYLKTVSRDLDHRHLLFGLITTLQNGELNYYPSVIIDSRFTKTFLRFLKFRWPEVDREYFGKVIKYIAEFSYLESRLVK